MLVLPWLYGLPETARRKTFLVISMVANLGILGFFKYFDFFVDSLATLLEALRLPREQARARHRAARRHQLLHVPGDELHDRRLPRQDQPTRDFGDFALFVCFFPHLVAGPIMRAHTCCRR